MKAEGELVISGTQGYIYVPAPWWNTNYFEIRYENQTENKKYFYQLESEGIKYELVAFSRSIEKRKVNSNIDLEVPLTICDVMERFKNRRNMHII